MNHFVPKPTPECRNFPCYRPRSARSRYGYCHECEHFRLIAEGREKREAEQERIAPLAPGQGVQAKIAGRVRRAEIVRKLDLVDRDEIELRYWLQDGTEKKRWFSSKVILL